jgi:hypothetical protein
VAKVKKINERASGGRESLQAHPGASGLQSAPFLDLPHDLLDLVIATVGIVTGF